MRKVKRIVGFLLLVIMVIFNVLTVSAQKFKLHAKLEGIETPLRTVVHPCVHIEYNEKLQELAISGVSVITKDMVEKYKDITKVIRIGTDVRVIGDFAFSEFKNLRCVYQKYFGVNGGYENHVQVIGVGAFKNCRNLETVFLVNRSGVTILENAFMDCVNLTWLNLYIRCIAHQAFVHCNRLKISNISDFEMIFYIAANAFEECRCIGDIGERISLNLEQHIWNTKVRAVSFEDGMIVLSGRYFDYWDILCYFVALKEHRKSFFRVFADDGVNIRGAHKVSADVWDLLRCQFCFCRGKYYDCLRALGSKCTVNFGFDIGRYLLP